MRKADDTMVQYYKRQNKSLRVLGGGALNATLKVSEGFPFPKEGSHPLGERQGHFRKGKYPMKGLDTKVHW